MKTLLVLPLVLQLLLEAPLSAANLNQCTIQPGAKLQCGVTEPLTGDCPGNVTSLILRFSGIAATWPANGGLSNCYSVTHLKGTEWSGPELTTGHLQQLASLTSVTLTDGDLNTVGPDISTNSWSELSLARNKITSIHDRSLDQCASLVSLDLSDNSIDHLASRLLTNCRSLRSLQLTGNRLTELESDALRGPVNLLEVILQKNNFKRLDKVELAFSKNPKVTLIDLRDNQFLFYRPGKNGFCGPSNVTVKMDFAGCPPMPRSCNNQCVGTSARIFVTFTNCPINICSATRWTINSPPTTTAVSTFQVDINTPANGQGQMDPPGTTAVTDVRRILNGIATVAQESSWLLYALAGTVMFALVQLIVSLAVCHRLKLRNARLQVRVDRLVEECPSHRCYQHPTLCSQSGLSGRLTPSCKGPSSQCGFSQCEVDASTPPSRRTTTPPPPPPPLPLQSVMPLTFSRNSAGPPVGGSDFGAEQSLRLVEDEDES